MRVRKYLLIGTAGLAMATAGAAIPAHAQYRGQNNQDNQNNNQYQDQRDRNQGYQNQGDRNQGQYQNGYRDDRGQNNDNYHRFDDRDRREFRSWYNSHRQDFRNRLPRDLDSRIGSGYRVGPEVSRYYRPVPYDLARRLPMPPPGYRYVMLGDRLVLLDNRDMVRDGFSFHLNL